MLHPSRATVTRDSFSPLPEGEGPGAGGDGFSK